MSTTPDNTPPLSAREAYDALGLPSTRAEAWRYFPTRGLEAFDCAAPLEAASLPAAAPASGPQLTLVNGSYSSELSAPGAFAAHAAFTPGAAGPTGADWESGLEAANAAFGAGTLNITLPAHFEAGAPLRIRLHTFGDGVAHPRLAITLGDGARLELIVEHRGEGTYLTNIRTAIRLAPTSHLDHTVIIAEDARASHVELLDLALERGAEYQGFVASIAGLRARTAAHVRLVGEGAAARLDGLYHPTGQSRFDHYADFDHRAHRTRSHATWAGAIDDSGVGTFQGRVRIGAEVRGCSTRQLTRSLLLSPSATANAKPELHIDCDEVEASHGATIGQLDAAQLFYLISRGIPADTARAILIHAFVQGAIARATEAAQPRLTEALRERFGGLDDADGQGGTDA